MIQAHGIQQVQLNDGDVIWAFDTLENLHTYLYVNRLVNKNLVTINKTHLASMSFVDVDIDTVPLRKEKRFVFSTLEKPVQHPVYGQVMAWGLWFS